MYMYVQSRHSEAPITNWLPNTTIPKVIVPTCLIVQCMTSLASSNNCKKMHPRKIIVALYYVRTRKRQESSVPPMQIHADTDTHRSTNLYTCAGTSEAYALWAWLPLAQRYVPSDKRGVYTTRLTVIAPDERQVLFTRHDITKAKRKSDLAFLLTKPKTQVLSQCHESLTRFWEQN